MKKYGYTEKRYISIDALRRTCIKEDWFNAGTNEEYAKLFDLALSFGSVTSDELVELATMICEHTDGLSIQDNDRFCNVLFVLAKDACISCFDIDR